MEAFAVITRQSELVNCLNFLFARNSLRYCTLYFENEALSKIHFSFHLFSPGIYRDTASKQISLYTDTDG